MISDWGMVAGVSTNIISISNLLIRILRQVLTGVRSLTKTLFLFILK